MYAYSYLPTKLQTYMASSETLFLDAVASRNAEFGQGSGPIVLKTVLCQGMEQRLIDCGAVNHGYAVSCDHRYDAGVVCRSGMLC